METKDLVKTKSALPDQLRENITDSIMNEVKELENSGRLQFPADYSYQNALKSAWLILQDIQTIDKKPVLEACTQVSIANSLMDMIIQGLSPAKKQCYFIPYGNKLQLQRSYFGSIYVAKQVTNMVDIVAEVIREGQDFEFDTHPKTGIKEMKLHKQPFNTLNNQIIGCYAIKQFADDTYKMEIMTREDIQKAWNQGAMKGKSGAHLNFEGEMCKKTVINRACKIEINSSSDSDIVIAAVNRTTEADYDEMRVHAEAQEVEETENLANKILGKKPPFEKMKKAISDGKIEEVKKTIGNWEWPEEQRDILDQMIFEAERKNMEETEMGVSPEEQAEMTNELEPDYISLDIQAQLEGLCRKHGKDMAEVLINFSCEKLNEVEQKDLDKIVSFIKA